jgi:hypothetical protein
MSDDMMEFEKGVSPFKEEYKAPCMDLLKKNLIVFYVNVGQSPPDKEDVVFERIKTRNLNTLCKLDPQALTLWIPIRTGETRVEYIRLAD